MFRQLIFIEPWFLICRYQSVLVLQLIKNAIDFVWRICATEILIRTRIFCLLRCLATWLYKFLQCFFRLNAATCYYITWFDIPEFHQESFTKKTERTLVPVLNQAPVMCHLIQADFSWIHASKRIPLNPVTLSSTSQQKPFHYLLEFVVCTAMPVTVSE